MVRSLADRTFQLRFLGDLITTDPDIRAPQPQPPKNVLSITSEPFERSLVPIQPDFSVSPRSGYSVATVFHYAFSNFCSNFWLFFGKL